MKQTLYTIRKRITLRNFIFISIAFFFLSCQSEKTNELDNLKNAFELLIKENIQENEIAEYYEFPFYNDKNIHYEISDFLDWHKSVNAEMRKGLKIEDIEIVNEFSKETYESELFRDNKGDKKLERILNLVKGKSKVFEVVFNKDIYLKKGLSIFVIYNTEHKKIIGFIE